MVGSDLSAFPGTGTCRAGKSGRPTDEAFSNSPLSGCLKGQRDGEGIGAFPSARRLLFPAGGFQPPDNLPGGQPLGGLPEQPPAKSVRNAKKVWVRVYSLSIGFCAMLPETTAYVSPLPLAAPAALTTPTCRLCLPVSLLTTRCNDLLPYPLHCPRFRFYAITLRMSLLERVFSRLEDEDCPRRGRRNLPCRKET